MVRLYLSYFPSRYGDPLPVVDMVDPTDRRTEELYDIVPANPRQAYDMRRVLKAVVDEGVVLPR